MCVTKPGERSSIIIRLRAAVGLVGGKAGIREYTDKAVNHPQIKRVRELATAVGDLNRNGCHVVDRAVCPLVHLKDGRKLSRLIEQWEN
jgi:hypothetical protein